MLARRADGGGVIFPFNRSLLPLRAPVGFARARRHGAERPDRAVAIVAEGDHAHAQKPVFVAGETYVAVKIRNARAELTGSHKGVERLVDKVGQVYTLLVAVVA